MKKSPIIAAVVAGVIALVLVLSGVGTYNGMAKGENKVDKAWSDVETAYQRRSDLIPNLVAIAEQAAVSEQDILTGVVEARAGAVSADSDDPAAVAEAEGELTENLNRLLMVTEDYPELQSNQNWLDLQSQVEGTENRINVARRDYNDAVQTYNDNIVTFPNNMFAGMFGFEKAEYFESDEGAENAPVIDFGNDEATDSATTDE